jgi:hypothetical protein
MLGCGGVAALSFSITLGWAVIGFSDDSRVKAIAIFLWLAVLPATYGGYCFGELARGSH